MKTKEIQVDHMSFNADHYASHSEADFIKDQLGSVPDKYGSDEQKKEFLKVAHAKIKKANGVEEPEEKKKAVGK